RVTAGRSRTRYAGGAPVRLTGGAALGGCARTGRPLVPRGDATSLTVFVLLRPVARTAAGRTP
ncbi:hypothetical protein, partial [Streptomyces sp. NPDC058382]|uniref:hypothetical protein n=1 Tax=Streptomyces sp. NPDC058382 TaxID=3346471 RepID=UPI003661A2A3